LFGFWYAVLEALKIDEFATRGLLLPFTPRP
jgi:hypothetical protein